MKNLQRNTSLDLMRWICAFLVVVIHVPIVGAHFIMPITRIAVPFFFMITGYYLYSSSNVILGERLLQSSKKWGGYYLCFTLILLIVKTVIESLLKTTSVFTMKDLQAIVISGVCEYLDVLTTPEGKFGISTMWFLYCGTIAMLLFYIIRKWLFNQITMRIIGIVSLFSIAVNYISDVPVVPRILFQSVPFLYLGMVIHRYEKNIKERLTWDTTFIIIGVILSIVTLYTERFLFPQTEEIYLSTPVLATSLFVFCIKYPHIEVKCISRLPVKVTMDIYVWHRLIYALLVLFVYDFQPFSALVVFMMCVVIFSSYRILKRNFK